MGKGFRSIILIIPIMFVGCSADVDVYSTINSPVKTQGGGDTYIPEPSPSPSPSPSPEPEVIAIPRLTSEDDTCAFGAMILNGWTIDEAETELICQQDTSYLRFAFAKDYRARNEWNIIGEMDFVYDPELCEIRFSAYVPSRNRIENGKLIDPILNTDGTLESFLYYCSYCGPATSLLHSCITQDVTYF